MAGGHGPGDVADHRPADVGGARAKAGMGSAMNDTTRELGGSLGVAVFGSLLGVALRQPAGARTECPTGAVRDKASSSLGAALELARTTGGRAGERLGDAARAAWMSGFTISLIIVR